MFQIIYANVPLLLDRAFKGDCAMTVCQGGLYTIWTGMVPSGVMKMSGILAFSFTLDI